MNYEGPLAYNENEFLETYLSRRARPDSPNNAIEGPIVDKALGTVEAANILDLGCGDGQYGKELLGRGACSYTGVEGSAGMFALASANLSHNRSNLVHATMESFDYQQKTYDVVLSRMAIHYIEDVSTLFRSVSKALKHDGKFIFSLQHPLTTSSFASKDEGERKGNWLVDDYFLQGRRNEPWMGKTIVKYHRTTEYYFSALVAAGFHIQSLHEGEPQKENFSSQEEYERRKRIPIILVFSCRKA